MPPSAKRSSEYSVSHPGSIDERPAEHPESHLFGSLEIICQTPSCSCVNSPTFLPDAGNSIHHSCQIPPEQMGRNEIGRQLREGNARAGVRGEESTLRRRKLKQLP